jgi:long-subunit acyl-CoA synthetase (AMP-forming)
MGLPIEEVYGMTERGMIAWNTPQQRREGSAGRPIPCADVHLADDGEVLVGVKLCTQPDVQAAVVFEDDDGPTGDLTDDQRKRVLGS